MGLPGSSLSAKKVLLSPKRLISRLRVIRRPQDKEEGELLIVVEYPSSPSLHLPLPAPQLGVRSPHAPDLGDISLLRRYVLMVRGHLSPLPFPYHWLRPEDVLVGEHPIAAGGFANIHEAMHGGRKVILKSYRCYVLFDVAQVVAVCQPRPVSVPNGLLTVPSQRFHSEVHVSSLLHRGGVEVVRLLGLYSTEAHPFGLVYEYMGGLDLRQHLRNNPNVGRLNLVLPHTPSPAVQQSSDASR